MKNLLSMRLLALATLSWAVFCPSAIQAQASDEKADNKKSGNYHEQLVSFGKDVELDASDSAGEVIVIGGSAKIHGTVNREVVVIGGDLQMDGHVSNDVVVVLGNAVLGSNAYIAGDFVTVGGTNFVAEGGKVAGQVVDVAAGMVPDRFMHLRWLTDYFKQCVMELRPLSLGVEWIWWIAGFFFIVYFLIAILFPHPVQYCAAQVSARPATTLAVGILAKIALPILCLLLPITIIGIVVVPFLVVAAAVTGLVGKVSVLEYLGSKILGAFGLGQNPQPVLSFLVGAVLLTLLYLVPIIGLLTFIVFSWWGMGAGVTAVCLALRANRQPPAAPTAFNPAPPPNPSPAEFAPPLSAASAVPPLAPPSALAYPRAGFWERMGAGFLDLVLVMLSSALVGPFFTVVAIAYFSGLWAWKGTTIGGMVLNLQVVRVDAHPLTFLMALVRSLAALFSAVVFFLGFFWIGWDRDKQGWHDKIAGTVVVRTPRSPSLVCI